MPGGALRNTRVSSCTGSGSAASEKTQGAPPPAIGSWEPAPLMLPIRGGSDEKTAPGAFLDFADCGNS